MEASVLQELLLFRIGGHWYAIGVADVQEVVQYADVTSLPGQPAIVEGFLNLRGRMVPVVRAGRLFGIDAGEPALDAAIIVMQSRTALLVDAVEGIVSTTPGAIERVAEGHSFNDCATGQIQFEGRPVHLLCPERILLAEERSRLRDLAEQAQRRIAQIAD